MGYLDGLISVSFKEKGPSASIFFPYGKFGRSYIISKDDELKIGNFLKNYYKIAFTSTILAVIFLGFYALFLLVILLPLYFIKIHWILREKETSIEKYQIKNSMKNMAISMGVLTNSLLFSGSILLTTGSVFILLQSDDKILGFIGFLFFAICSIISFVLLISSIRYRQKLQKNELRGQNT